MTLNNFIPALWSARLIESLKNQLVYAQAGVVTREWEGEIRAQGDTVKINMMGPVTVSDYTKNTNLSDPETLTDAQLTLVIEKSRAFNFAIDDIDKVQSNADLMSAAMIEAAYALAQAADQYIAGVMVAGVGTGNQVGTEAAPKTDLGTAGKAYEYLTQLGTKLSENSVPKQGRWVIVPPWFIEKLQNDDRFVKAGTLATDAVLRNGQIGQAAGFTIFESNNVPYTTATTRFKILAGYAGAVGFAEQASQVEAYRPEKRFGDAMKGLHLYGAKVVRSNALAMLVADKA